MIKLLQLLFIGHVHKWEVIKELRSEIYMWHTSDKPYKTEIKFIQKCQGCGKLQEFTTVQGIGE